MLDPAVVKLAEVLLAEGLSQRAVARRLGISRGTVHAIKHGLRRDPEADRKREMLLEGLARRCPHCGRLMRMPVGSDRCLACLAGEGPDVRPPIARVCGPPRLELRQHAMDRLPEATRRALKRQALDPEAADRVEEDAVAEKQRRVEMGFPGDTEWRRVEEGLEDVEDGEPGRPTAEDLAEPEN